MRFSRSGSPHIEATSRTHWGSPELSGRKRERLAEKAHRAAEAEAALEIDAAATAGARAAL